MNSELKQAAQQGVDAELAEMEAENNPAREPVAWIDLRDGDVVQLGDRLLSGGKTWRTVDLESNLIGRAYRAKQWWPMQRAYTHPAPGVPDDIARDAERGRFLVGWLKRFRLLQAEFGQIGAGEKSENWWLLNAPWGIDKTRPFFGHGKTPEQAIDAAMLAASQAQKGGA